MINIRYIYRFTLVTALFIGAVASVGFISSSQQTYFWYKNGEKDVWQVQGDVFAFTTNDGHAYAGYVDHSLVDSIYFRAQYPDKLQLVYFKGGTSFADRNSYINGIRQSSHYQRSYPVVTRFNTAPYTEGLWYVADNQILVTFRNGNPSAVDLSKFKNQYALTQLNDPSNLPAGGVYSYIFSWDVNNHAITNSLDYCQLIYEHDSTLVANAEPNLIKAYRELYKPDDYLSAQTIETSGEEELNYYIYLENNSNLSAYFDFKNQRSSYHFVVVDLFGREYTNQALENGHSFIQVDVSELAAGVYVSCLVDDNGAVQATQKFRKI